MDRLKDKPQRDQPKLIIAFLSTIATTFTTKPIVQGSGIGRYRQAKPLSHSCWGPQVGVDELGSGLLQFRAVSIHRNLSKCAIHVHHEAEPASGQTCLHFRV